MFYMVLTSMSIGCNLPFDLNSYFMYYFKQLKLKSKQLIDDMTINL